MTSYVNTGGSGPLTIGNGSGWTTCTATTNGTNGTLMTNSDWTTTVVPPQEITIKDEYGNDKTLSLAETTQMYSETLEYRRILRFSRIFPGVKSLLKELLVMINLHDPYDEEELLQLESDSKNNK